MKRIALGTVVVLLLALFASCGNGKQVDTTPPVISAVAASGVTSSVATITWVTDESATSEVAYGLDTSYNLTTTLDTSLCTGHSLNLTGLAAATLYHYQVKSKDAVGNEVTSADYTFTTTPLAILSGQPTGTVNYNTANITVAGTNIVAYQYKLDAGNWSAEISTSTNITLSALSDGLHTISIIGKDATGNWQLQASPTTASWTVDTTLSGQPSEYPLTVTDLLNRTVQVPQKPARIVTTHPTATEMLYRVGGVAVGRDTASKYPPEAQNLTTVGGSYTISTEAVAALEPDLILIEALTQASLVDQLEPLGVPIIAVRATSLEDIVQSLTLVGKVVDMNETAAQAIADIQGRIEAVQGTAPGDKNILIFIADANNNIYAAKPESYPGTVAALLGLGNLAADLPDAGGMYTGYAPFSAEQATQSNPDVVFTITPAPPPVPRLSAVLSQMPGFKDMPAVEAGHIVELDPVLFLQAPGPRIADAVEGLLNIMNNL